MFVLNDQAVQEFQAENKNTKSGPAKMCNFANLSSEQASFTKLDFVSKNTEMETWRHKDKETMGPGDGMKVQVLMLPAILTESIFR